MDPSPPPARSTPMATFNYNSTIEAYKNVSTTFPPVYDELLANGSISQDEYDNYKDMYDAMNKSIAEGIANAEAAQAFWDSYYATLNSPSPAPATNSSGLNVASIVGISLGAVATLALIVGVYLFHKRGARRSKTKRLHDVVVDENTVDSSAYGTVQSPDLSALIPWDDHALLAVRVPFDKVVRGSLVSRGAFGEVYRGRFRGQDVAIKTLLPDKRKDVKMIKMFIAEIKFMSVIEHPRIVSFLGVSWEALSDLCVVTEFMAGGDLYTTLSRWDSEEPRRPRGFSADKVQIALHIAHALTYLHSLQPAVVHRDLKSKNVLLDTDGNAKVADFGISRERVDRTMTAAIGSSLWMAPEVMLGERYNDKADIFSFGVVLSELDTQQLPYADTLEKDTNRSMPPTAIMQLVSLGRLTIALTEHTHHQYPVIYELARECVSVDPTKRPTAAEALHRLNVVWKLQ